MRVLNILYTLGGIQNRHVCHKYHTSLGHYASGRYRSDMRFLVLGVGKLIRFALYAPLGIRPLDCLRRCGRSPHGFRRAMRVLSLVNYRRLLSGLVIIPNPYSRLTVCLCLYGILLMSIWAFRAWRRSMVILRLSLRNKRLRAVLLLIHERDPLLRVCRFMIFIFSCIAPGRYSVYG